MTPALDFIGTLEAKVAEQLKAQRVGYLLGAGSSYLDGAGYPLAFELWDLIKNRLTDAQKRAEIQGKLDGGASEIWGHITYFIAVEDHGISPPQGWDQGN